MCELFDFDDNCSAILMEYCNEVEKFDKDIVVAFFKKVINGAVNKYADLSIFHNYSNILHSKAYETNFEYKKDKIMLFVDKAIKLYDETFKSDDCILIHGDLHRYNIMSKDGQLLAIDPIGYIAPVEIDLARYIGTELTDRNGDILENYNSLIEIFSSISDVEKLKKACFIDMVFRLHNSLFENEDCKLTDKWINVLKRIDLGE